MGTLANSLFKTAIPKTADEIALAISLKLDELKRI